MPIGSFLASIVADGRFVSPFANPPASTLNPLSRMATCQAQLNINSPQILSITSGPAKLCFLFRFGGSM